MWIPAESSNRNLSAREEFTCVNLCRESDKKPLIEGRIHSRESLSRVRQKPLGEGRFHLRKSLPRIQKRNLSANEEFTYVNPYRESEKKPLGEGRIHLRESLQRARQETSRRRKNSLTWIPAESLKRNLSAKEEFTCVNLCWESDKKPPGEGRIHLRESLSESRFRQETSRRRKNSPTWIPIESLTRNLLVKEEFTCVNPCRESDKKPLCEGRFHLCESLSRVQQRNLSAKEEFTYVNPCRESEKKSLSEGRIHLRESPPRVRQETSRQRYNSPAWIPTESLTKKPLGKRKNSPTWIPSESPTRNLSAKEEFTYVNPCRESDKKPLGEG